MSTLPIEDPERLLALPPIVAYWLGVRHDEQARLPETRRTWFGAPVGAVR